MDIFLFLLLLEHCSKDRKYSLIIVDSFHWMVKFWKNFYQKEDTKRNCFSKFDDLKDWNKFKRREGRMDDLEFF